ncbi:HAMP domain-containing histidine kinase [Paenibacillus antri]|uniref:histidine kinase n=1 Tax=Paenibacillus antri TaxID=2582848 RepID=A0A5R9G095_9BACL|nr:HAMP domain-containing histidine kinase [Paenibacillus antri]
MKVKKRHSLLWKYLLLIAVAVLLLPVAFTTITILFYEPSRGVLPDGKGDFLSALDVEALWHEEARSLEAAPQADVAASLERWQAEYPDSTVVWVDAEGRRVMQAPDTAGYPASWTRAETIRFMKDGYDADPFTVVAQLGTEGERGFLALTVPRRVFESEPVNRYGLGEYSAIVGTFLVLALFMAVSAMFFYRVRGRLLRLRDAMTSPSAPGGLPEPVAPKLEDEVGQLERAFNDMLAELTHSREREREEEALRRELIASLSHDLRTPLTAIRGHAYRLAQEASTEAGRESAALIDRRIGQMDRLIDNLLSYTLLSAGKYPFHPKPTDVARLVRTSCAGWYATFEREGFEIDVELPEEAVVWEIDPGWMERVLDNLFQNVLRHAKEGRYVGVRLSVDGRGEARIAIADRGGGMERGSGEKGAGIGLSIAELMLREMRLRWTFESGPSGTTVTIDRNLNES